MEIRIPKTTKIALVKQRFEPTADFLYFQNKIALRAEIVFKKIFFAPRKCAAKQKILFFVAAPFKIALGVGLQALSMRDTLPGSAKCIFCKKV